MSIKSIIIGILALVVGFVFVWKSEWFFNNFGRINFFETKMGIGSSRFGYKLIGLIIIMIGTLVVSGLWGKMFVGLFGAFFGGLKG